jgi:hypothetical protein
MVGLPLLLRRHEGEVPVRSTVAMVSGVLVAAFVVLDSAYQAGAHRSSELDDAQLAFASTSARSGSRTSGCPSVASRSPVAG